MTPLYVYAGPTISRTEINNHCPQAICLPPVRCGDIFKLMRLNPKRILIIDGYFESCPSVWHKELLFALSKGVQVIGASSMGAMRAAELVDQGMIGIGKAYHYFNQSNLSDDDEVAVLHLDQAHNYQLLSDAMIDIRETLKKAIEENIIHQATEETLVATAKETHFHQRKLNQIMDEADINTSDRNQLLAWLPNNWVHQKKMDALEALDYAQNMTTPTTNTTKFISTSYARTLQAQKNSAPFDATDWLPEIEKVISDHKDSAIFKAIKRLVRLLEICHHIALNEKLQPSNNFKWLTLTTNDRATGQVEQLLQTHLVENDQQVSAAKTFMKMTLNVTELNAIDTNAAHCWACLSKRADHANLIPSENTLNKHINAFVQQRGHCDLASWTAKNNVPSETLRQCIVQSLQFNELVKRYRTDCINGFQSALQHHWLSNLIELMIQSS